MPLNHQYIIYKLHPEFYSDHISLVLDEILRNNDLNWESIDWIEKEFNLKYDDYSKYFNERISCDSCITIDYVKNNIDKPWDWFWLSQNTSITIYDINNNPDLPWKYQFIHISRNYTLDDLKFIKNTRLYDDTLVNKFALDKNITYDMVKDIFDDTEILKFISMNHNSTFEILTKHINTLTSNDIISRASECINITPNQFIENIDFPWKFDVMCYNPNLTMMHVEAYIQYLLKTNSVEETSNIISSTWGLFSLIRHVKMDISFIKKYKDIFKHYIEDASINSGITLKDIDENPDIKWDFIDMDRRNDLTFEFIKKHHNKTFTWDRIIEHPCITFDMVKENPQLPWNKCDFIKNSNATYKDILEICSEFDCDLSSVYVSYNRYNASITIQRYWKKYLKRCHRKKFKFVMTELNMNPHNKYAGEKGYELIQFSKIVERDLQNSMFNN